jgi:multidrug efflux pump subunit AcrA (membrane-fusion protein)
LYTYVVQIVPNVRGTVIDVPVEANKPIKQGDILFRIAPEPFQTEVDRLQALLASKNVKVAQLSEQLAAAQAATSESKANLLVAESQFDRAPEIDESRQRQYVYMIRDLGSLREPAAYITVGSTIVFLVLCWLLHRRDRFVAQNLARKAVPAAT